MNDVEVRRQKFARWAQIGLIGGVGVAVSPVVFLAVKGIAGLLACAALVTFAYAMATPFGLWMANLRYRAVVAAAQANPIPTRWNIYNERADMLADRLNKIEAFIAKIGQFRLQVERMRKTDPDDVTPFEMVLKKMVSLKEAREGEYEVARNRLAQYKAETEKAERIWNMAMAAREMGEAANVRLDPLKEIAEKTALDTVELEMTKSFAQLDRLMLERVDESATMITGKTSAVRLT